MEEREMKKIHLFIVTLITCSLITLFVACEKDEEIDLTTISVSKEQFTPSYTSASIQCSFNTKATLRNVYVQYATSQDFVEYDEIEMSKADGIYSVVLDGLQDNTTYYIRYAVSNRYSSAMIEEISTFQTLQPSVPTITLKAISDIWDTHAKAQIALEFDGGSQISEMGICWNTQTAPVVENNKLTTKDTVAVLEIKDLQPNTRYFVRSYAMNKVGVAYSEEYEFTTFSLPEIKTEEMTDVQLTTAMLHGTLVFNGNDTAAIKGFCWSTNEDPTVENNHIEIDTASAMYTYRLSNLIDETQYYVRAYAQNKIGIVYGETKSFTTMSALPPIVSINEVTDVDYHTATITADVISDGGADVTERGICYSTAENPTTESTKIISGKGTGSYTINLSNLQDSTTYYVRAYAINKKGIAYGEQKSFMTKGYMLPTITTANPTNVEYTSATVGGNISSDGGASVTECGICYSTTENPAIESNKIVSGKGTGSYTINLTDLQDSTTYYVRAYAINKKGIAYGEQKSFITKASTLPSVTTSSTSNISYTSATVGGNVTSDGGANITERGVVYSTTQNPTTSNSKENSGSGIGSFTCSLSNLQVGTTYYVRAYAVNKKGTAYGEQQALTTKASALPSVTTSSATNITYTSATVGGNVTSDGGENITERGVVYSTTQNPTTSNSKVSSGNGAGSFSCSLSNLQVGTTYYIRAYAINKKGTAYGEQQSFTTNNYEFSISSSKQVTFSMGNLQYHPLNDEWRFAPSQLDYIGDANRNISSSYNGWLDLFGWSTPTTDFGVTTSTNSSDYSGSFVDWGTNQIGTDSPNTWRTLMSGEWQYLLNLRNNASSLKGVAQVNGVNGLILLPDTWTCPSGITFRSGFHSNLGVKYYAAYQTFTIDEWSKMEKAGAVFLPAAGVRSYTVANVQNQGYYWSSTTADYLGNVYYLYFISNEASMKYGGPSNHFSVRLVKDL